MDLSPYADALRGELASLARATGPEAEKILERLSGPLDAALRLVIQEAVSDAAQEISRELAPGSVDVRVRGRDLGFVVTPAPEDPMGRPGPPTAPRAPEAARDSTDGGTARLTVRLMDQLKVEVEAAADREGLSVNAFLVRMLAAAVQSGSAPPSRQPGPSGNRMSGWVQ
ncbi:MAG: histidine kinase [Lapillicoccus sp.]